MTRSATLALLALFALALLARGATAQVGAPYCFGENCPCGNDDPQAGCGNFGLDGDPSTGATIAVLGGGAGFLDDDLVLEVRGVAAGQLGLVFMGGSTALAPFGDGLRCIGAGGGAIVRFPIRASSAEGAYSEGGLVAASQASPAGAITAGATHYFQGWFRDPAGPCGSGFNLTHGLPVTFQAASAPLRAELAGVPLAKYPHFEYTAAFPQGEPVHFALDTARYWFAQGETADVYVVESRTAAEWQLDPTLVDVRGGPQAVTFSGTGVQDHTFLVDAGTLNGTQGADVGVGYDLVLDFDRDGLLGAGDLIDGLGDEAGFYVVRDTAAPGPHAVAEATHNAGGFLLQVIYYPADIAALGELPLVVVSHGNGHNYTWYGHIGHHLASYGYIVMSHRNNTVPGPDAASLTTLDNTDHLIGNQATIAGGVLAGHIDARRMFWIGHSRGGEGVVRAYDRLFDGTNSPVHFSIDDVRLVSSIAPTNFLGPNSANPHGVDYHLWVGSADADVSGTPQSDVAQSYQLFERAEGRRASITLQGCGHAPFHNGGGTPVATGPCQILTNKVHPMMRGYILPLVRYYLEGDPPSRDFLWRPYDLFRPIGAPPFSDPCVVVHLELEDGPDAESVVLDDYQQGMEPETSSAHGPVLFDVADLFEGRLDDANSTFTWIASDPMNGMTRGSALDVTRGVVFGWNEPSYYEVGVVPAARDFRGLSFLSFRACQASRHPNTIAELGDLAFTVTLRDGRGAESSIAIDAYGSGVGEPYQRTGAGTGVGWGNEFETIRIRLTDFLTDASGLALWDVEAVRFEFGGEAGSAVGRIGLDDVKLTRR